MNINIAITETTAGDGWCWSREALGIDHSTSYETADAALRGVAIWLFCTVPFRISGYD